MVDSRASASFAQPLVRTVAPLRVVTPSRPISVSPSAGRSIIPATCSPSTISPTSTAQLGSPHTKARVPSTGSRLQLHRRVRAHRAIFLAADPMVGKRRLDRRAQRAFGGAVGFGDRVEAGGILVVGAQPGRHFGGDRGARNGRQMSEEGAVHGRLKAPRPLDRKARARLGPLVKQYDAIILGAGAAGLMAALVAGQRGKRVLLIDHADQPGKKILISGGGRCNFTNLHTAPDRYLSANPHFMKSALARYTARDFLDLVERHGIAWHEKTLGQLFCDGSARQIVAMLWEECAAAGVELWLGHPASVERGDGFSIAAARAPRARRASSSPPAGRRSPRWARPASLMTSPARGASRSSSRAPRWCR